MQLTKEVKDGKFFCTKCKFNKAHLTEDEYAAHIESAKSRLQDDKSMVKIVQSELVKREYIENEQKPDVVAKRQKTKDILETRLPPTPTEDEIRTAADIAQAQARVAQIQAQAQAQALAAAQGPPASRTRSRDG